MHLSQYKLCTRKMELALEVKFISTFTKFTRPWWRMLTNGSDVKYIFPWCPTSAVVTANCKSKRSSSNFNSFTRGLQHIILCHSLINSYQNNFFIFQEVFNKKGEKVQHSTNELFAIFCCCLPFLNHPLSTDVSAAEYAKAVTQKFRKVMQRLLVRF